MIIHYIIQVTEKASADCITAYVSVYEQMGQIARMGWVTNRPGHIPWSNIEGQNVGFWFSLWIYLFFSLDGFSSGLTLKTSFPSFPFASWQFVSIISFLVIIEALHIFDVHYLGQRWILSRITYTNTIFHFNARRPPYKYVMYPPWLQIQYINIFCWPILQDYPALDIPVVLVGRIYNATIHNNI